MISYQECASEIVSRVGGTQNIKFVRHCSTRIFLELNNPKLIEESKLEETNGIKGLFFTRGYLHIILGYGTTNKVFAEIEKIINSKDVKQESHNKANNNALSEIIIKCERGNVVAPIKGTIISRENIPDNTFSSGVFGEGVGIIPDESIPNQVIRAPFPGSITAVANGNHSIGFVSISGLEVLIHVGIDTFRMNGKGFKPLVKEGDRFSTGDPILQFDIKEITRAGLNPIVVVMLINSGIYKRVECIEGYSDKGNTNFHYSMEKAKKQNKNRHPHLRHCSFCKRSEDMVNRLISGPDEVYICDECVAICCEILEEAANKDKEEDKSTSVVTPSEDITVNENAPANNVETTPLRINTEPTFDDFNDLLDDLLNNI